MYNLSAFWVRNQNRSIAKIELSAMINFLFKKKKKKKKKPDLS